MFKNLSFRFYKISFGSWKGVISWKLKLLIDTDEFLTDMDRLLMV